MADLTTALVTAKALGQAKASIWDPLAKKFATSADMGVIYAALNDAITMLSAIKDDHRHTLQRFKMKIPSRSYNEWIRRVEKSEEEVMSLQKKYDKHKDSSQFLYFFRRSGFSAKMKETGANVVKLLEEAHQFQIFVDPPPKPIIKLRAPNITKFPTLQARLENTLDLLKNDQVMGISILGMMGTGKSAILRNLNNHDDVSKMFDIVMWINVSREESEENLSIEHIQKAIGERLKVDMTDPNNFDSISESIAKELDSKKYLLLLDDVKDDIDIYQTGVPFCNNGSKIVLTTRWKHVCSPIVDQVVKVAYLSNSESWIMFRDIINRPELEDDPFVEALVRKIVGECGGHPLLIRAMGSVFRMKDDVNLWTEGFNSLKRFPEKEHRGIKEMYRVIRFCFDDLGETERKCFLYGTLYPEGSPIYKDYLLECWEAEDFFGNDTEEANINGHHVLEHLKTKSLLEEGEERKFVTMQKCIRQVALYIASDDPQCKYMVSNMWKAPKTAAAQWNDKIWISLGNMKFEMLPDCPDCGMLSTLFLQKNLDLDSIPSTFFAHMRSLKVLDLCHTGISCLPTSFSDLVSLKVLYLRYCSFLLELPSYIQELQSLEVLDIRGSGVKNIPSYINKFKDLRRLRVSFFSSTDENEAGDASFDCALISELSFLEELVIEVESPEKWSNQVVGSVIKVVAVLKQLTCLQFWFSNEVVDVIQVLASSMRIHVPDMNILDTYVMETSSWRNIQHFQIFQAFIGCEISKHVQPRIPNSYQYTRYVKSCNCLCLGHHTGQGSIKPIRDQVLASVDAYELVNHHSIKKLSDLGIPSMNQMRGCLIENCSELYAALDNVAAPNLEHLYLKNLEKLQTIWSDQVTVVSVTHLKTLVLNSCHVLKVVFPFVVIQQLCEIEHLRIEDCPEIVKVFESSAANNAGNVDLLPKLRELILLDLPNLESICASEVSELPAMEKFKVRKCPALRKLPFRKDDAHKMKLVEAEKEWLDALQ